MTGAVSPAAAQTSAVPRTRSRRTVVLDLVPLGLAIVAEAAWITVAAGLVAEYTLHAPYLGLPAFALFVVVGVVAGRILAPRAGERWPGVALFLVALAGLVGWLSDPAAAAALASSGVFPALSVNAAGWLASVAVLRGFAHATTTLSASTLATLFGVGVPCLAIAAVAGGMIAEPYRALFLADATVAVVVFAATSVLALALVRLSSVGAGQGFDWRRNPTWVGLLIVLVLTTLAIAVPASVASPLIALIAGAAVGPLIVVGLVVGFERRMLKTILFVGIGAIVVVGVVRLLGGSVAPVSIGGGGAGSSAAPPGVGPTESIGLLFVVLSAMVLVLVLARMWARRTKREASDVHEERSIDRGDASSDRPRPRRLARRRALPEPTDAVSAYLRLIADLESRGTARRDAAETPAMHAARLRAAGEADLGLDLLAADYALARFGGVALSGPEDRRAIARWRRLRSSLGRTARAGGRRKPAA